MAGTYKKFFKTDKAWEKTLSNVQQKYGLSLFSEAIAHKSYFAEKVKSGFLFSSLYKLALKLYFFPSLGMCVVHLSVSSVKIKLLFLKCCRFL